ncbi:MAG: FecR domain-containing protein [Candidatus Omnitrophica bacterium]|nr:FecR domain-containing protein [Candidatus Omnitrophota bacterium]
MIKNIELLKVGIGVVALVFCSNVRAQEDLTGKIALLTEMTGTVELSHDGGNSWQAPTQGDFMAEGDWVRTQSGSTATVAFDAGSLNEITLQSDTQIRVAQLRQQAGGGAYYVVEMPAGDLDILLQGLVAGVDAFEVKTPTAVIAARGTTFNVRYPVMMQAGGEGTEVVYTEGMNTTIQETYTNGEPAGSPVTAQSGSVYTVPSAGPPPEDPGQPTTVPEVESSSEDEEFQIEEEGLLEPHLEGIFGSWRVYVQMINGRVAELKSEIDNLRGDRRDEAKRARREKAHQLRDLRRWSMEVRELKKKARRGEIGMATLPPIPNEILQNMPLPTESEEYHGHHGRGND